MPWGKSMGVKVLAQPLASLGNSLHSFGPLFPIRQRGEIGKGLKEGSTWFNRYFPGSPSPVKSFPWGCETEKNRVNPCL